MSELVGGCQCGNIRYRTKGAPLSVLACHCIDCQKQSGSAFGLVAVFDEGAFELTSGELKTFDALSEAGREKTGAFCPDCGCRIHHVIAIRPGKVSIRAGTFDDTSTLKPEVHIWTKSKQDWVEIPEGVKTFEGQPG